MNELFERFDRALSREYGIWHASSARDLQRLWEAYCITRSGFDRTKLVVEISRIEEENGL